MAKEQTSQVDSRPYRDSDVNLMLWQYGLGMLAVANSPKWEGDVEALNKMASDRAKRLSETFKIIELSFSLKFDYEVVGKNIAKEFTVKKVMK